MEVIWEFDLDDNDEYSLDIDAPSLALIVFPVLVLRIPFVAAEINWVVDSSDSLDKVRSFSELNRVVKIDVSDEIGSLFTVVADAVDNVFVCPIEETV